MKNWKWQKQLPVYIPLFILGAGILSACGAATTAFQNTAGSSLNSSGTTVAPIPTPTPTQSTALNPALSFEISNTTATNTLTGQGGTHPVYSTFQDSGQYLSTDNLLKVQVSVQSGGLLSDSVAVTGSSAYSGFSATYDCASFEVDIYDNSGNHLGSQQTEMLQVAGSQGCLQYPQANGPVSQILDFSGNIAEAPHGPLDVRVTALQYDFYCKLLYDYAQSIGISPLESSYYSFWCPSKIVYKTHTVSAGLEIEVNGTTF
jgi:hypothetical protein